MEADGEEYADMFKLIFVGSAAVGKTQLIRRIAEDQFSEVYTPTGGANFSSFNFPSMKAKLQLWDLAGQQRYQSVRAVYYKSVAVAIFVYSVTDANSFACIPQFAEDFRAKNGDSSNVCLLVGNKTDLPTELRQVKTADAEATALKLGMLYCEISTKTDDREVILCKLKETLEKYQLISQST